MRLENVNLLQEYSSTLSSVTQHTMPTFHPCQLIEWLVWAQMLGDYRPPPMIAQCHVVIATDVHV